MTSTSGASGPHWVDNLDPVAIHIYGNIGIRWYSLAYLFGIVFAASGTRRR